MITASLLHWHDGDRFTYRLTVGDRGYSRVVSRRDLEADESGLWLRAAKRWSEATVLLESADRLIAEATPFGQPAAQVHAENLRRSARGLQLTTLIEIFPDVEGLRGATFCDH